MPSPSASDAASSTHAPGAASSSCRARAVFVPFHYGYWDEGTSGPSENKDGDRPRAANELTRSWWDPVSKQPMFKTAAARVLKVGSA